MENSGKKKKSGKKRKQKKHCTMCLLSLELYLGLGHRSRFDFGCFGCKVTEETEPKTNRRQGSVREALSRSRAEHKILRRHPQIFFWNSQDTFVKGTKDSNKDFLKEPVTEGIGTMYLFLIVPHFVSS